MGKYGIPFKGSKSQIAEAVVDFLPPGKRLVDLFGGGGAISHCACSCFKDKYEQVYYNEIDKVLVDFLSDAIADKYSLDTFKPEFIDRNKFNELKDKDGYIKYIWSFSNNGKDYLYGKDIEDYQKSAHNWIVFNEKDNIMSDIFFNSELMSQNIQDRRQEFKKIVIAKFGKDVKSSMYRIQQLERFGRLEKITECNSLIINNGDYRDYEYVKGDVVYCDIPYENTNCGCYQQFDHKEFYNWAAAQPYDIYISSYNIDDDRFTEVWHKSKQVLSANNGNSQKAIEKIYINKKL